MADSFQVNYANISQDGGDDRVILPNSLVHLNVKMPIARIDNISSICTKSECLSTTYNSIGTKLNFSSIFGSICIISLVLSTCLIGRILLDISLFPINAHEICEKDRLKQLKLKNPNRLLIGHLNVNSYRNKID